MQHFTSKLPQVGQTVFSEMSQLALECGALNLGQGFPDFPMDEELIALVNKAMQHGHNQYAHTNGVPALRQKIAGKIAFLYGTTVDPESQITVTPGGTYAIFTALATILQAGDEVIIFEPAYDCYGPTAQLFGASPVYISLPAPDFAIPWEEVADKITDRTKAIIINSPHNPTGSILGEKDIAALKLLAAKYPFYIISDEVYEHLIFDGKKHLSILREPELLERSFVCFSFGKVYNCTGWKLGYAVSTPFLMGEFRKIHQFNCFSCFTPTQVAIARFLDNRDAYLQLGSRMQVKRDFFRDAMRRAPFEPLPSFGSYFQCYQYNGPLQETGLQLAKKITRELGVASIPVSAFYHDGGQPSQILRFCFSKTDGMLQEAAERLEKG